MPDAALAKIIAEINKKEGPGTVVRGSEIHWDRVPRITSGSLSLDIILGGGWMANQWHEIIGHESCLVGDTFIKFQVRDVAGKVINHKGGSIHTLWSRFHGQPQLGRPPRRDDAEYWVASVNEEDRIVQNRVVDVVETGVQESFEVRTRGGLTIRATADHRFLTADRTFARLKDIQPGQRILTSVGERAKKRQAGSSYPARPSVCVKHHPSAPTKVVRDSARGYANQYHRVQLSHLYLEAYANGLSYDEYVRLLNSEADLSRVWIVPKGMHVHHLNEDWHDNRPGNLQIIDPSHHGVLHATERHNDLRFTVTEDEVVTIDPVGEAQTYDISMAAPYHNYVANNFVVHNSGKTACAMKTVAANQANDPDWSVWWLAAEGFDPEYAQLCGMDLNRTHVHNTNVMEDGLEECLTVAEAQAVDCIVIDSYPALVPEAEDEKTVGGFSPGRGAQVLNQFFRKQGHATRRSLIESSRPVTCFLINQWRDQIGVMYGDPRTTPGGKGKNFAAVTRVETRRGNFLKPPGDGAEPYGQQIHFRTIKNKTHRPHRTCEVDFYFAPYNGHKAGTYDRQSEIVNVAVSYGVLRQGGGGMYYYGDDYRWKGLDTVKGAMAIDTVLADKVSAEVLGLIQDKPARKPKPPKVIAK